MKTAKTKTKKEVYCSNCEYLNYFGGCCHPSNKKRVSTYLEETFETKALCSALNKKNDCENYEKENIEAKIAKLRVKPIDKKTLVWKEFIINLNAELNNIQWWWWLISFATISPIIASYLSFIFR